MQVGLGRTESEHIHFVTSESVAYLGFTPTGQVQRLLSQLVYLFVFNGFAWDGSASLSKEQDGTIADYILTLQAPANLWSGQGLQLERSSLKNDFL